MVSGLMTLRTAAEHVFQSLGCKGATLLRRSYSSRLETPIFRTEPVTIDSSTGVASPAVALALCLGPLENSLQDIRASRYDPCQWRLPTTPQRGIYVIVRYHKDDDDSPLSAGRAYE